ncbi:MAG: hypothetical protein HY823_09670 [Acidobacteria bacterium]|nr:hypothetical protein [Acidobacteriota bacterium]
MLHLSLPSPVEGSLPGNAVYLAGLTLFFLEAAWEGARFQAALGAPFGTPSLPWVRANLLLDLALVVFLIAFQGVDQERFATLYIFPVLASAFYLSMPEIVGMGILSSAVHIGAVMGFASGVLPAFGLSGSEADPDPSRKAFVLAFATLQVFGATLVVMLIRRSMESLRRTLNESEAAADDLSALHRRVVESLFSGLITTDLEGRVTSANPAAEVILMRPLPAGLPLSELLPADLAQGRTQPHERRFECALRTPSGTEKLVGGNVAPVRSAEGGQVGFLLLFQDLTEIKALEERTRLSEKLAAVGELSSGLAHELRNPLASILGCVQILKGQGQNQAMLERVLGILGRESERVSAILTRFLDYARQDALKLESLWLPTLIRELRESWDTDARNREVTLEVGPIPERWVSGDSLSVHQVFTNLLSNARKALGESGVRRLTLGFEEGEGVITATVADSGRGMNAEQLGRLFVPFAGFFEEGTGLGMSLVYQFTRRMGWDIRVQSEPGRGTAVSLDMPAAPPPSAAGDGQDRLAGATPPASFPPSEGASP